MRRGEEKNETQNQYNFWFLVSPCHLPPPNDVDDKKREELIIEKSRDMH